jgi:N-acetylneuraminic acid mutarotase
MKHYTSLFALTLTCCATLSAQTWTTGADIPVPVRAGNTAAYVRNGSDAFLYVASGRMANGQLTKKLQRYEVNTDLWTEHAPHPTGLLGGATAVVGDSLYVIGGVINPPGNGTNKVYRYNIDADVWSAVANLPIGIVDAKAVAYQDSLIYVVGGLGGTAGGKVYVYNAPKNLWRVCTSIPVAYNLNFGGLAIAGDTIIYMCGTSAFGSANFFNTVHVGTIDQSNRSNITWTQGAPFPGNTRTFFDAHAWQNGIVMTGGSTDNTFNTPSDECYAYDAGADAWSVMPTKPTPWLTGQSASVRLSNGQWKLLCTSGYNTEYLAQTELLETEPTVGTQPLPGQEAHFWLKVQNPASNASILVQYELSARTTATITLTNALGQSIKAVPMGQQGAGTYSITIQTDTLPAGRYQVHLQAGAQDLVRPVFVR